MEKILTELRQMRLPGMAQTWQSLMETRQATSLNIVDGLRLLLQGEHDMRRANRNARLLKNARFRYQVSVDELPMNFQSCSSPKPKSLPNTSSVLLCDQKADFPVILYSRTKIGRAHV